MSKTILITGSTDGIGLEAAKKLAEQGHRVLLHGRNPEKLQKVADELSSIGEVESYIADLTDMDAVRSLAKQVSDKHKTLDVLMNNAGILKSPNSRTKYGIDIRFVVNSFAPYLLTTLLLPLLKKADQGKEETSRVINLSSAAQAPVNPDDMQGKGDDLSTMVAYSQSKLALTMWSFDLADSLGGDGPAIVALNPGSLIDTKMVQEGFGHAAKDITVGTDILVRAALSDEFARGNGKYFDNDSNQFADPHPDCLNPAKRSATVQLMESIVTKLS